MSLAEYRNAGRGNWLYRADYFRRSREGRHVFRLQVHPVYTVQQEQEEFQRFLREGTISIDKDDPGLVRMRERKAEGRIFSRVYVVEPPLTGYQRYAFVYYHYIAEAGEDLRIIDLSSQANPGLPDYDFMLIDGETVIKIHYEKADGAIIGAELLPDADIAEYTRYRDLAVSHSIPFLEYEKTINI